MSADDIAAKFDALDLGAPSSAPPTSAHDAPKGADAASQFDALDLDTPSAAPSSVGKVKTFADLSKMPFAQKVMHYEDSTGDPNAKAPTGTAAGVGQFVKGTWTDLIKKHRPDLAAGKSDVQIKALRSDPQLSEQMIDAYGNDNADKLKASGIPVSDASKYGAHWFGPENFAKIYNADPKTPIEKIIGKDAAASNGLTGKTADDVKTLAANRMGADYMPQDMSWSDTLSQAGSNLLPSVGHMAAGVYETVRHPVDTYHTLKQIGVGLESKVRGYAGEDQDPKQKVKDEALVDALGQSYKDKYSTLDGFKQYLAHDPAGVAFDASTVLTAGGGLAAKIPGVVGKAGELAGAVGKAVNPLNPLGVVSGAVKAATMPAAVLDKAGNVVPKVDALIKKVTNGGMSAADLVDPDVKAAFAATVAKKGASEASVREGLLKSLGLKTPTSVVEGVAPPLAAKEAVTSAVGANNDLLKAHAGKIAGAQSPSDLGAALDQAHTSSLNAASAAYDKIRTMPGSFGPQVPEMGKLGALIKANFQKSGIPNTDLQSIIQTGHPQAAGAIKLLKNYWGSGKTLTTGNGVDATEIATMRKGLNNARQAATGQDVKAVGDVIDAFDQHLQDLSQRGLFRDTSGRAVPGLGQQIKAANTAYRAHFNTFDQSANPAMRAAIAQLKDKQQFFQGQRFPSGDVDRYTSAQGTLGKQLMDPTKGANTYNQLSQALGNTAPLDNYVKSALANPETKNAAALLNTPVGTKAFAGSPDDLSRARHMHAASAINNAKPTLDARSSSVLKGVMGSLGAKGLSSVAGYEALGASGLVVGPMLEGAYEKIREGSQAKAAMAGAKPMRPWPVRALGSTARRITNPTAIAAEHYENQAQKIQRASGGKVDTEALVARLVNRWKHAKRATNETTKPLLNVHDDVIAKALHIAQRSI
jgi:hypothetical protein